VRLVSANEVAARIGVTLVTLWSWSRNGKFPPPRRVGTRNIAWLSTDVDEWIRNLPMQATEGTWRR
jgi:predicted DNA-binding transcriptional regulator AlpA